MSNLSNLKINKYAGINQIAIPPTPKNGANSGYLCQKINNLLDKTQQKLNEIESRLNVISTARETIPKFIKSYDFYEVQGLSLFNFTQGVGRIGILTGYEIESTVNTDNYEIKINWQPLYKSSKTITQTGAIYTVGETPIYFDSSVQILYTYSGDHLGLLKLFIE